MAETLSPVQVTPRRGVRNFTPAPRVHKSRYPNHFYIDVQQLLYFSWVSHVPVPESARQNVFAQEAAEEVSVDELRKSAKEAAREGQE